MDKAESRDAILVYHQGGKHNWGRWTRWIIAAMALAGIALGVTLFLSYGSAPGDGGQLAPVEYRLGVALASALGWIPIAVLVILLQRRYVHAIHYEPGPRRLAIRVHGVWDDQVIHVPVASVAGGWALGGAAEIESPISAGPMLFLRLKGRMLPLFVDLRGEIPDTDLFRQLLRAGPAR